MLITLENSILGSNFTIKKAIINDANIVICTTHVLFKGWLSTRNSMFFWYLARKKNHWK